MREGFVSHLDRPLFLLGAALAFASGCTSLSTLHTARPITAGTTQIGINAAGWGAAGSGTHVTLPTFELQVRHGLSDMLDLGVKVYPIGVGADVNVALINTENFALSLDPGASAIYFGANNDSIFVGTFWLPVLADVVSTDVLTLTVGPKFGFMYASATVSDTSSNSSASAVGTGWLLGGMAGLKFQFTERFGMMPELDVYTGQAMTGVLYHAGLAFLF